MSLSELKSKAAAKEGFIIISPANRRYLTDFPSDAGYLIVSAGKSVFLTDSRYIEAARESVTGCDEIILLKKASEQLPECIKALGIEMLYTESDSLTVSGLKKLQKDLSCPVSAEKTDSYLSEMRRKKQVYERKRIESAQRLAESAFDHILRFIKPGVTEKEIRLELDFFMLKNGAEALSFDTIALTGRKTSMPHGVPGENTVRTGDFVTMDYGAVVDGYHSDMTRTVAVGDISGRQAEVYETVLRAQISGLEHYRAGVKCSEGDAAARTVIAEAGYGDYFGHGTGHGVGIDIHEAPTVSPSSSEILCEGDVVTCEPGIYIPGEFGVRIEDMAYITESGCDNLTHCEKHLIVV